MGINFGDMGAVSTSTPSTPVEVQTSTGITLDLAKATTLDLTKKNPGLKKVTLGAGWDVAVSGEADLDISAFMLDSNGKITGVNDIVFFNNMSANGVRLNGDNRTGEGEGDDETIDIDLSAVPSQYESIVFIVSIYEAKARRQTFGMINNAYVRLLDKDKNDKEICRFRLKDDASSATAVIFAKLKRNGSDWEFEAIGEGKVVDDLNGIVALFS